MIQFKWSPRKGHTVDEELDLIIFPGDATFVPYLHPTASTTGRIYVLKFSSSSQRHFFWWQTKAEGSAGEHSRRDRVLAKKINRCVQIEGHAGLKLICVDCWKPAANSMSPSRRKIFSEK